MRKQPNEKEKLKRYKMDWMDPSIVGGSHTLKSKTRWDP